MFLLDIFKRTQNISYISIGPLKSTILYIYFMVCKSSLCLDVTYLSLRREVGSPEQSTFGTRIFVLF